jgi:hypothetical protein
MGFSHNDLTASPVFLLDLTIGGHGYRFASQALDVVKVDGTALAYAAGLGGVSWKETVGLGSQAAPLVSVPLQVLALYDWAAIEAAGHDIAAGSAELSKWVPGSTWEKRKVLAIGTIDRPQYGAKGEPLAFALVSHPYEDRSILPPAVAIVDAESWPDADTAVVGRAYPTVIGEPGVVNGTKYPGSPGLLVDPPQGTIVICDGEVAATAVHYRTDERADAWTSSSVTTTTDGRGRLVSTMTIAGESWTLHSAGSNTTHIAPTAGADLGEVTGNYYRDYVGVFDSATTTAALQGIEFRVSAWNSEYGALVGAQGRATVEQFDGSELPAHPVTGDVCVVRSTMGGTVDLAWTTGGGIYDRTHSAALRSAGDVVEHLLGLSTLKVDRGRMAATSELLRGFKLDLYYDTPSSAWERVSRAILPFLPVSVRAGPSGLYVEAWDFAAASSAVLTIDADAGGAERVGPIRKASTLLGELANEFRVSYARDANSGAYREQLTLHGDAGQTATARSYTSKPCRLSRAAYGPAVRVLDVDVTADPTTAGAIATQAARIGALPVRLADYQVPERDGLTYRVGAPVEITDSAVSLTAARGVVTDIADGDAGKVLLSLVLFHEATRAP